MEQIIWTDENTETLLKAVEYDMVRYEDESMFTELTKLHRAKFNYFISKGRYKTQTEFEDALDEYVEFFKDIAFPDNLVY